MKTIAVAGGGIGGTIVANRLCERLRPEIEKDEVKVAVFDRSGQHVYQPGQLFAGFGLEQPSDLVKSEEQLLSPKARLMQGKAGEITKIDVANHALNTGDGKSHPYDYLVMATGSVLDWDLVPGLKESMLSVWDMEGAQRHLAALRGFQGGTIVVNVARLPHKCPVGPLEETLMLEDYLRRRGLRDKTELVYAYPIPGVFGIPNVNKVMTRIYEERGIRVVSPFTVKAVDPQGKTIESNEGEKLKFDLLLGVPPHMGSKVVGDSAVGDRRNWVPTDKFSLQMKDHSDVFVMGDTTDIAISKAGSTADFESYVVADNVANGIRGSDVRKEYDGSVFCFIATGMSTATYIRFNYNTPPVPPPPSGVNWWSKIAYNKLYWSVTAKAMV
ncbi:MAG: NAD(P)/FAD-dependent oxidoreductase [Nitrososphaerota archaeon]|nr:NAD(P)/FAD-dependent oxidoreductase [Nitrososphaerota archaeon]